MLTLSPSYYITQEEMISTEYHISGVRASIMYREETASKDFYLLMFGEFKLLSVWRGFVYLGDDRIVIDVG